MIQCMLINYNIYHECFCLSHILLLLLLLRIGLSWPYTLNYVQRSEVCEIITSMGCWKHLDSVPSGSVWCLPSLGGQDRYRHWMLKAALSDTSGLCCLQLNTLNFGAKNAGKIAHCHYIHGPLCSFSNYSLEHKMPGPFQYGWDHTGMVPAIPVYTDSVQCIQQDK